jgi:hypothetical protein
VRYHPAAWLIRHWEEILAADYAARIVDNTHLLDATEIFRKLNVHKKVRLI